MTLTVQDILTFFNAKDFKGDASLKIKGVQIDSRKIKKDDVFVALKGTKVDGHDYVSLALQNGAALCLVEKSLPLKKTCVCPDTTKALADLAKHYRLQFKNPLVGITGSSGKTSTKTLMQHCFSKLTHVQSTKGNLNNHLGVPLTLLNFDPLAKISIVEMGMSAPLEIQFLCSIVQPSFGLITSIGAAHLENFDSKIENVAKAKGELFDALSREDTALINLDDSYIVALPVKAKKVTFGFHHKADIRGETLGFEKGQTRFAIHYQNQKHEIRWWPHGRHHIQNALGVFACGVALGFEPSALAKTFEDFQLIKGRGAVIAFERGVVIDDTYNANPSSMKAAFIALNEPFAHHYKVAVLGDMFELGTNAEEWHKQVGEAAFDHKIDCLLAIGPNSKNYVLGFKNDHAHRVAHYFDTADDLLKMLKDLTLKNENLAILFKGSRGMKMEQLLQDFLETQEAIKS